MLGWKRPGRESFEVDDAGARPIRRTPEQAEHPATGDRHVHRAGDARHAYHWRRFARQYPFDHKVRRVVLGHPEDLVAGAIDPGTASRDELSEEHEGSRVPTRAERPWHRPGRSFRNGPATLCPLR